MIKFSTVEMHFFDQSGRINPTTEVPFIVVDNYPKLGYLTALRFLEWVSENPEGVISLPTGKTPEYFIKWVYHLKTNWNDNSQEKLRRAHGLNLVHYPVMSGLQFVQIDEFFPIDPNQHNSFYHYVRQFYLDGFGLEESRAQLMNCDLMPTSDGALLRDIFVDSKVDLSLRYRECRSALEQRQQQTLLMVDQWCSEYEERIREKGGIGFFLGGIGPDGHIAFNVRGSDHYSTTRLMETNFETQAAAAGDLGGIEISKSRLVITIGLSTITCNPDATAIIMASGEAKANIVRDSLEGPRDLRYPASVLQNLKNGRFYLTEGAATQLSDSLDIFFDPGNWNLDKSTRAITRLCKRLDKFGHHLTLEDLKADIYCSRIPDLGKNSVVQVIESLKKKLAAGLQDEKDEAIYHTGPHHDDIMLGYLPHILHLVRTPRNRHHFAILTSGFTSVTNGYLLSLLNSTLTLLKKGLIQMLDFPDYFDVGYTLKRDKDIHHYLDNIASRNIEEQLRGLCHRVARSMVEIYKPESKGELAVKIEEIIVYIEACYDGQKNPPDIQKLKGMIREFEEELVWSNLGLREKEVTHLRLGFYTGDIFTEQPENIRDVKPLLEQLKDFKPSIITLALDPEGSGPDTHYKVLQTIAEAVRQWAAEHDASKLRIWGYRNVWYRFHPGEADIIVPISLGSMAAVRTMFMDSYLSQKDASFPSHEYDGPFSDLVQKIWVEHYQDLELLLGKDYWYQNEHPRLRAAHGALYLKEMNVDEFLHMARTLEKSMEGQIS